MFDNIRSKIKAAKKFRGSHPKTTELRRIRRRLTVLVLLASIWVGLGVYHTFF